MPFSRRWLAIALAAAISLGACGSTPTKAAAKEQPAKVEAIAGTNEKRLVLTAKAVERLAIKTAPVQEDVLPNKSTRRTILYAAVVYDTTGGTWTYTSPSDLTYVRKSVTIERVEGDLAILTDGPLTGTPTVIVGAPELLGIEYGVGH
jgi:hypothetical protein